MTIDDIANFCQFTSCQVSLGASDAGFIQIAGTGVERRPNYDRYLSFNEMSAFPSPKAVLAEASVFKVHHATGFTKRSHLEALAPAPIVFVDLLVSILERLQLTTFLEIDLEFSKVEIDRISQAS